MQMLKTPGIKTFSPFPFATSLVMPWTNLTTSTLPHTARLPHQSSQPPTMKLLTLNFLTCAIKTCKTQSTSFPLHPRDAELEIQESDVNLPFLKNILPRLMWDDLRTISKEVRLHRTLHCTVRRRALQA